MTDRIFLQLSANWAVGYDHLQWIVMRAKTDKRKEGQSWRPIAFVVSSRAVLMRVLEEKDAEVTPEARAALDSLPDTFREWIAGQVEQDVP